jgi:hypothetical protein
MDLVALLLCCIRSLIKSDEIQGQEHVVGEATYHTSFFTEEEDGSSSGDLVAGRV